MNIPTTPQTRPSAEWCQITGITVLDPDGWDRMNLEASWAEPITRAEFMRRCWTSTISAEESKIRMRLRSVGRDAIVDRNLGAAYVHLTPNPPNGLIITTPADTADWPITINVDFDADGPYGVEILFNGSSE